MAKGRIGWPFQNLLGHQHSLKNDVKYHDIVRGVLQYTQIQVHVTRDRMKDS